MCQVCQNAQSTLHLLPLITEWMDTCGAPRNGDTVTAIDFDASY